MSGSIRSAVLAILMASACGGQSERTGGGDDMTDDAGNQALQCTTALACPAPSGASKQTICGQLYDLENGARFGEATVGTVCTTPTASGPCSLSITPYDAIAFATNPASAAPLAHGAVEIDSCGRYRIQDVDVTAIGPFVGIRIDDAAGPGPSGTTVTTAIATPKIAGAASDGLEAWIVKESTTTQWASTGGPALAYGVYVPMFRAHKLGTPQTDPFEPQSGVTVTKQGNPITQYYFDAAAVDRTTVDADAVTTGANGTALIANASINDSVAYAGSGGIDPVSCRWQPHVGVSLPGIVFVQVFRPLDVVGQTCAL